MKRNFTFLKTTFLLLSVFIVVSSHFWCVNVIETSFIDEMGFRFADGGYHTVSISNQSLVLFTLIPFVCGIITILLDKYFLHIILTVLEFLQLFLLAISPWILESSEAMIGGLSWMDYEFSTMGYITVALSIATVILSIVMTRKCHKRKPKHSAEEV